MDMKLKRTMWMVAIVAIAHCALSVWFGSLVAYHQVEMAGGIPDDYESFVVWGSFDLKVFFFLQPQFWLAFVFQPEIPGIYINDPGYSLTKVASTLSIPLLVSIPLWSICFGFLFTTAVSWRTRHSSLVTCHS